MSELPREQRSFGFADRQFAIGSQTWAALCDRAITPVPRNFELLFAHYAGQDRHLSERLQAILADKTRPVGEQTEAISDKFIAKDVDADALDAGVAGLVTAAHDLVADIASNQQTLAQFGRVLGQCAADVSPSMSVESLLKIVTTLKAETEHTADRNRVLEQQLAASSQRISKLKQNLVEVRHGSTIDALTGIANRKTFDGKLRRAMAQAKADPTATFALVLLDVDHFKRFNDTHGHRTGDQVLKLVGRMLSDNVKGRDTAARYGGEEFVLILADADLRAGATVADQIRQRLSSQNLVKRGTGTAIGQITISAGVAQHQPGESGASMIERADAALYEAKGTGRDRVCLAR